MSTVYSTNVKNEITLLYHPKIQEFSENPFERPEKFSKTAFFVSFQHVLGSSFECKRLLLASSFHFGVAALFFTHLLSWNG